MSIVILVILLNMNTVQTFLANRLSEYFSKQWNATVEIHSVSFNMFSYATLKGVRVVDPNDELVLDANTIRCRYRGFPLRKGSLHLKSVYLKDTEFHFKTFPQGSNLSFIIDYFKSDNQKEKKGFRIDLQHLELENITFSLENRRRGVGQVDSNRVNVRDMYYSSVYLLMEDIQVIRDSISTNIHYIRAKEKSGLEVKNLQMKAVVSPNGITAKNAVIETSDSKLMFDAALRYHTWQGMKPYVSTVWMDAEFKEGTYGCMKDAEYWAHSIVGSDVKAYFSGDFHGTVSDFETEQFKVKIGDGTVIQFGGKVDGLPKIKETLFNVNIDLRSTSLDDFNTLKFPEKWNVPVVPPQLASKGSISMNAGVNGLLTEGISTLNLQTELGDVDVQVTTNLNEETQEQEYALDLNSTLLNLKPIVSTEWVQGGELHAKVRGKGLSIEKLNAEVEIGINNFTARNYVYDSISIKGNVIKKSFGGGIQVLDNNIGVDFYGLADIGNGIYNFELQINEANIAPLNLGISEKLLSEFSTRIRTDLSGSDIDNITGRILIDSIALRRGIKEITPEQIEITLSNKNEKRNILLASSFLDFSIKGGFFLKDISHIVDKFTYTYLPQYNPSVYAASIDTISSDFRFKATVKDVSDFSYLFDDKFDIAQNTVLKGSYSEENSLETTLKGEKIRYRGILAEDLELSTQRIDSVYDISFLSPFVYSGDMILLRNSAINVQSSRSLMDIDIWWDGKTDSPNKGEIHTRGTISPKNLDFRFLNSQMTIQESQWAINQDHHISVINGDFLIDNLVFRGNKQKIEVNAEMSDDAGNEIVIGIENFELERLNFFTEKKNILLGGAASGSFTVNRFDQNSHFKINFDVEDLELNNETLGDAVIKSTWEDRNERLRLQFDSKKDETVPLFVSGYYYPRREKNNLDFDVRFQSFPLRTTARFIESIAADVDGDIDGNVKLTGTPSALVAKGELNLHSGSLLIRYLNTRYYLNDKVRFAENLIDFKKFQITDSLNNKAFIDGKITHSGFKDFKFDLGITSDKFLFMNTNASQGLTYYGTILASASATVKGNVNHLDLIINARSEQGTTLTIPVAARTNIEAQKYIQFVSPADSNNVQQTTQEPLRAGLSYNMVINLAATPDAKISLPMSFGQFGGDLAASGNGDLKLGISSREGFSIFGTYTIGNGTFRMQLVNLLSKDFTIQNGGTIQWTGNPLNGTVDIRAIYPLKASLEPLFKEQTSVVFGDATQNYRKRVDVQSILKMNGPLSDPEVKFDIDFPYMDAPTQEMVYSVLDKSDERIMLEHTMALLFLNVFYSSEVAPADELIRDGVSTGINALTSQIGNVISNMTGLNIGLEYEGRDDYTTERWNVNLSEEWGNFYVEGRLGFGGTEITNEAENASNFIGDILVGYRISNHWSLTAFNRSNVNDFTKPYSPYTQGIGVSYKKDFDTLKELFTSQRRKKKKEQAAKKEEETENSEQETGISE